MTFGNLELHLIKGRPVVPAGDDLMVSHVAISVRDVNGLMRRMSEMGIEFRTSRAVPDPTRQGPDSVVNQVTKRTPTV